MNNELLKKYYQQTSNDYHIEMDNYTFYDVYEVTIGEAGAGGGGCCGCILLCLCCRAIANT